MFSLFHAPNSALLDYMVGVGLAFNLSPIPTSPLHTASVAEALAKDNAALKQDWLAVKGNNSSLLKGHNRSARTIVG